MFLVGLRIFFIKKSSKMWRKKINRLRAKGCFLIFYIYKINHVYFIVLFVLQSFLSKKTQ